ncbi:MAG: hypothetical protein M0006_05650 [Magnetospirillum sp.]|nr:hypothetical protein [Magnetospirillum sp.]
MSRRREVAIGQRYQPTQSNAVWEILELVRDAAGIQHARLIRIGDPTAIKMISASALKDVRLYRLLTDGESAA